MDDTFSRELGNLLRSTLPEDPVPDLDEDTINAILFLAWDELERVGEEIDRKEREWADLLEMYGPSASGSD